MPAPGVPENCIVLVVGVMAVWALANVAAIAEIKTRQMGSCQGAESLVRFKVVPSCPVSLLGYGIFVSKKPHSSLRAVVNRFRKQRLQQLQSL
jgi:hypothetical protein